MFIKILLIIEANFSGERIHFSSERTQGECVIRANRPDTVQSIQTYLFRPQAPFCRDYVNYLVIKM
jgi:hypothetical protein